MNESTQRWVESALRSLDAAQFHHEGGRWPQTCFHAQQAVEMALVVVGPMPGESEADEALEAAKRVVTMVEQLLGDTRG